MNDMAAVIGLLPPITDRSAAAPGSEEDTEDEGPLPPQQQQPAADNGSGTDTDDDGELIRKVGMRFSMHMAEGRGEEPSKAHGRQTSFCRQQSWQ